MQRNDWTGRVKIEVLYGKSRQGLHTSQVAHQFLPVPSALDSISLLLTSQILLPSGDTASEPLLFLVFR